MSNSKPITEMDHSRDGLNLQLDKIEEILNKPENKRKNILELKEQIEGIQHHNSYVENYEQPNEGSGDEPELQGKLQEKILDQITIMK